MNNDANIFTKRRALTAQVENRMQAGRTIENLDIMQRLADDFADQMEPGKINAAGSTALFLDNNNTPSAAPIDPIVISYYQYDNSSPNYHLANHDAKNLLAQKNIIISQPLYLSEKAEPAQNTISHQQLRAVQSVMGHVSCWWPVTDYSKDDFVGVFQDLELRIVACKGVPIGIVHMDFAQKAATGSAKIVFIALDPKLHGKGLGKAILHEAIGLAYEQGAQSITLDTVHHCDIRSVGGSAAAVYEKAGFILMDAELIDPADLPDDVTINQLNAPKEYFDRAENIAALRIKMYEAFGVNLGRALKVLKGLGDENAKPGLHP